MFPKITRRVYSGYAGSHFCEWLVCCCCGCNSYRPAIVKAIVNAYVQIKLTNSLTKEKRPRTKRKR